MPRDSGIILNASSQGRRGGGACALGAGANILHKIRKKNKRFEQNSADIYFPFKTPIFP